MYVINIQHFGSEKIAVFETPKLSKVVSIVRSLELMAPMTTITIKNVQLDLPLLKEKK